jgi:hypothetical protein
MRKLFRYISCLRPSINYLRRQTIQIYTLAHTRLQRTSVLAESILAPAEPSPSSRAVCGVNLVMTPPGACHVRARQARHARSQRGMVTYTMYPAAV